MTVFRRKPTLVEAHLWTGKNLRDLRAWMTALEPDSPIALLVPRRSSTVTKALFGNVLTAPADDVTAALWVAANDAYLGLVNGEWVMHDQHGFYPCKDDGGAPAGYDAGVSELDRGWTRHGHPITGRVQYPPEPTSRARCGGPGLCDPCSRDAAKPHRCVMPTVPDHHRVETGDVWRCDCGICWRANVFPGDQREPGRQITFTRLGRTRSLDGDWSG